MELGDACGSSCCSGPTACRFTKALLAQGGSCECAERAGVGEADVLRCTSAVAHRNCSTLVALLRERSGFALRLPRAPRPLLHAQALRLECGGVAALREVIGPPDRDVHRLVQLAQERHGSLMDLPWDRIVPIVVAWRPRSRTAPSVQV